MLYWISKISNMSDILPTLPDSVSRPWLCLPGNHLVVCLYGLSDTLPVLFYTVTVLSGSTCRPVMVQYLNTSSRQAVDTNGLYLKGNRPVINIPDLTWSLPVKTGSLQVFERSKTERTDSEMDTEAGEEAVMSQL